LEIAFSASIVPKVDEITTQHCVKGGGKESYGQEFHGYLGIV
jgi:hypothetical protein